MKSLRLQSSHSRPRTDVALRFFNPKAVLERERREVLSDLGATSIDEARDIVARFEANRDAIHRLEVAIAETRAEFKNLEAAYRLATNPTDQK